jgi:hypothetical protein
LIRLGLGSAIVRVRVRGTVGVQQGAKGLLLRIQPYLHLSDTGNRIRVR